MPVGVARAWPERRAGRRPASWGAVRARGPWSFGKSGSRRRELVCEVAADPTGRGSERCSISQAVSLDPGRTKVVLGVVADYLDSPDVLTLRFRLAPTAERRAGIGLKVDDRPEMRLPLDDCNAQRCEAAGRLRGEALKRWREGKAVQLAFIDTSSGRQVLLPISLDGFVPALNALTRLHRR